jgi:glutamine amidotransferase
MCRLVAYLGHDALLEDVLVKPTNSIVMQSLHARETDMPTNGDGFGIGWYNPLISKNPGLFTSISPAWNDRNLLHLAAKIMSPCFFSHVRAASAGGVTHYNSHPFSHENLLFMHNGGVGGFKRVKRHLRHLLDDDIYSWIKGETDSEHVFGLFLQLAKERNLSNINTVADTMAETINTINDLVAKYAPDNSSNLNLCLTDGKRLIATRYATDTDSLPRSLHYTYGSSFQFVDNTWHMLKSDKKTASVLVASEVLTDSNCEWHEVKNNHMLIIDDDLSIACKPL